MSVKTAVLCTIIMVCKITYTIHVYTEILKERRELENMSFKHRLKQVKIKAQAHGRHKYMYMTVSFACLKTKELSRICTATLTT